MMDDAGRLNPAWACRRSVPAADALAGGPNRVPPGAEGAHALPVGVARLAVFAEPVERVAVVGHLRASVAALARPEQRLPDRPRRRGLAARQQGRPLRRARPRARASRRLVLLEEIQRPAAAVDEERPERAVAGLHRGR